MAADGEPGWLFAAQDAGIPQQLRDGVRALLIDTHYGFARRAASPPTSRASSKSREKLVAEVGERFVAPPSGCASGSATPASGTREIFLCHAFCEVGATRRWRRSRRPPLPRRATPRRS